MLRLAGTAGEGDHRLDADLGGKPHGLAEVAVRVRGDRLVGVKRIAMAGEGGDLEAVGGGSLREAGPVMRARRRDLDGLAAGGLRRVQRLIERPVVEERQEQADLHSRTGLLVLDRAARARGSTARLLTLSAAEHSGGVPSATARRISWSTPSRSSAGSLGRATRSGGEP